MSDGNGGTDTATVTVTVSAENDAPVAVDDSATTSEDTAVQIAVLANDSDPDGDTLSVASVTDPPHGTAVKSGSGVLYTPDANYNGSDSFSYTASDGKGGTDSATVTVTVTPVNDAPVAVDDSASTSEDTAVQIAVLANDTDVDGDTLSVASVTDPANGTAVKSGSGVQYTPDAGFVGTDGFSYTVSDGSGGTDTADVVVSVQPSQGWVEPFEAYEVGIDLHGQGGWKGWDNNSAYGALVSDAQARNGANSAAVVGSSDLVHEYSGYTSGRWAYKAMQYVPGDFSGTQYFIILSIYSDGGSKNWASQVSFNSGTGKVHSDEDGAELDLIKGQWVELRLEIDLDADTQSFYYGGQKLYEKGWTAGVRGGGALDIAAVDLFANNASVIYYDDMSLLESEEEPNTPPVAEGQTVETDEEVPVDITLVATDADGDALTYSIVAGPANGVLSGTAPAVTYTPNAGYNGGDSFTFKANDGPADSNVATVTVNVLGVNDPPVAVDDTATTTEDTAVTIAVLANDTDVDGDTLTVASVTDPAHGTAVKSGSGVLYTPDLNYYGADSFAYTVSDGKGGTDTATVSVTVTPVNDAPVAVDDSAVTNEDTAVQIAVLANDTDVDGDTLTVASVTDPAHGTAVKSGSGVLYTPNAGYDGADSFTYTVSDGNGGTDTATVSVTVNDVTNNPPVAVATADPTHGHVPLTVAFDGSASYDPDGDAIVDYEWDMGDGNSAYGIQVSHTYTAEGEYTATLYVFDEYGNVGSMDILITAVLNTPPVATNSTVTTNEDEAVAATLAASDADGDALTYVILSQPSHGQLSGTAPDLTYAPAANWSGTDAITFKVSDGMDESGMATVTITVLAVNDAPVADDVSVDAWADRAVNVVLGASDIEGDALTFAVVADPAHGTISDLDPTAGTLLYTPDIGYVGNDSFTYVANDGQADSNVATVTLEMAEIRIVSVSTGKPYSLGTAEVDALYYIDRNYVISDLSSALDGQVLVRTANNDKYVRTENHLVLSVGRDVTLSVCYDKRVTVLPAWLDDGKWELTGEAMMVKDKAASPLLVYEQTFAAGQITLGGNCAGGAQGAKSNYVVVARVPGADGLNGEGLHYVAGPLGVSEWLNQGDADGDGLLDGFEEYIGLNPGETDSDIDGTCDESETGPDGRDMWDMQEDWLAGQIPGDDVPGDDVPGDDIPGDDIPDDGDYGDDVPGGGGGGSGGGCFLGTAGKKVFLESPSGA